MNMKKICSVLAITALVSFSIGAVAFKQMGFLNMNFHNGGFNINLSSQELLKDGTDIYNKENVDIDDIDLIKVSVSSSNMYVAYEDRSDVEMIFEGKYVASGSYTPPKLVINKSGDMIDATIEHTSFSNMSVSSYHNLLVKLPMAYKGKLKFESVSGDIVYQGGESSELVASTSSGSFIHGDINSTEFKNETVAYSSQDILTDNIQVETVSGDIEVESSSSKELIMGASSGDIKVKATAEKAKLETVSGYISGTVVAKDSTEVSTSSGDVDLESLVGDLNAKTVSGRMKLGTDDGINNIKVEASSGDVEITKVMCKSDIRTVSGFVDISMMDVTGDISIKTSSGDVRIDSIISKDFDLDVKTSSGDIDAGLAVTVSGKIDEDTLKGAVGSGGHILSVETVSGSIDIN